MVTHFNKKCDKHEKTPFVPLNSALVNRLFLWFFKPFISKQNVSMKRISSILLACVFGMLTMVGNLSAQVYSGGAATLDWQDPVTWNTPGTWPGRLNNGLVATLSPTAGPVILNNSSPAFRVKQLVLTTPAAITLNGTGTLTIGALNLNTASALTIGPGLNVVVDSIIDGAANSTIIIRAGGTLTLRRGVGAPNVQIVEGGTTLASGVAADGSANSTLVIENGFNNGIFPTGLAGAFINLYPGEIQVNGNFLLNDTYNRAAVLAGQNVAPLNLVSGTMTVTAGVTMTLNPTSPNSLIGAGVLQSQVGGFVVLNAGFNAGITPGARFANPFFGQIQYTGANNNSIINSNLTLGVANGTTSGTMNIVGATSTITVPAGVTLTLNGSIANALQGGAATSLVTAAAGGTIVLGPGFNAGTIPARFATIAGTLRTEGALQWNITGNINAFSTTGTLDIGGDLALIGNGAFAFTPTSPNSLRSRNNARISAQGFNTIFQFLPNANNGVIPGRVFSNPWDGGFVINSAFNLVDTLVMGTASGQWAFANQGSVVTIQANSELALNRTTAGAVVGLPPALVNNPGIIYNSYFQGLAPSSVLRLGAGFNGGNAPSGDYNANATVIGANTNLGCLPFLPMPFNNTTTGSVPGFNGRLVLEGSLNFNRDLRMGPSGILDLKGGNYTVAPGRALQLYNTAAGSLTGTGFVQGNSPTRRSFAPTNTNVAAQLTAHGSIIEIGPGFNGAVIPAARFANPLQSNLCVSTAGNIAIQGDLVLGVPGTIAYLNFNQGIGYQQFVDGVAVSSYTTTSTTRLTINSNSSLRLNGTATATVYGAAANNPGVSPVNTIQGTDITSRLIIGSGHGSENNVYARTTNATFLASPFNGTLEFDSFAYLSTDATVGVNGRLVLGGTLIITTATLKGKSSELASVINEGQTVGTTLTLLNQGANTITGLGNMIAGTGNTILLGAGANGGILPGNRFANPHHGTIATVGAMTLEGFLQLGAQRDGVPNGTNNQHVSSSFLALGGKLTVGAGSVLTVSNATVNPFVVYNPLTFFQGQRFFQISTAGNLDAAVGGEIRLADGFAAVDGRSYAAEGGVATGGGAFVVAAHDNTNLNTPVPTRSNIRGDQFASPFNGRLTLGAAIGTGAVNANNASVGGRSRFNLTTGTLTIGPSGSLNLISPLYITAATYQVTPPAPGINPAYSNGLPVLVLNNTGAGSLITSTSGSFIQSSVGSFSSVAADNFAIFAGNETTLVTGGTVLLGPGFNNSTIEGKQFGDQSGFSGRLRLPASGNFTLASNLTMLAPSYISAAAPGLAPLNYGILDLGGSTGNPLLTIADGITLSLGTSNTIMVNLTGRALQGNGTIQGATNNARLVFNGNSGGNGAFAAAVGITQSFTNQIVTAANIASPFNGRLVITTNANAYVFGNLVIGAAGTANGILDVTTYPGIVVGTAYAAGQPALQPRFLAAGTSNPFPPAAGQLPGSSITINNTSSVAAVLPGNGAIGSTSNFNSVILGPNALGNVIPAAQLANPFTGRLVVTTGSAAFTLGNDLQLASVAGVVGTDNVPGAQNGFFQAYSPININSGITLGIANTAEQALRGTGPIQGADGNATVYFRAALPGVQDGGNRNVVPGNIFANPYNGRVQLAGNNNASGSVGFHLYGGLTLGGVGTANGFLSVSNATLYLAAATSATSTTPLLGALNNLVLNPATVGTLTINNTLPVDQVLPGGGTIYPKGQTNNIFTPNGALDGSVNSRLIYGPGSLAGIVPFHKSSTNTIAGSGTIPAAATAFRNGIYGTIILPNTSVTATSANNPTFINGGTLVIGTGATASTTVELVLNAGQILTIGTSHGGALAGIGSIRVPVSATDATVRFGGTDAVNVSNPATTVGNGRANGGLIDGNRFGSNYLGTIRYHDNMNLTNTLRLGDGSATTGRLVAAATTAPAAGSLLTILQNSTLDLRTLTNGIGNFAGTAVATGLIAGIDTTSRLILQPGFETAPNNVGGTAVVNQSRALLNSPFLGALYTSTGTTTLFGTAPVTLTIGGGNGSAAARATGALEIGGDFIVPATQTLVLNQAGANSFRRPVGGTGLLLANPTNAVGLATVTLGAEFNNSILPVNQFGSTTGVPNAFGVLPTVVNSAPSAQLTINGGPFLTLSGASGSATTPANFTINQDLQFTALGGGIHIPASSTLRIEKGFAAAATASPVSRGYIQGTTGFGATQSVLEIGAGTRVAGNTLSAATPSIGSIRAAAAAGVPAFTGVLRFLGNGTIAENVTIGTTSALDISQFNNSRLTVNTGINLNLLNQAANSLIFTSTALPNNPGAIAASSATSSVNLGPGFNNGFLPGAAFGSIIAQAAFAPLGTTTASYNGTLNLGGSVAAPGSTLTLSSDLNIGNNGIFDFTGNNNDLILGAFNSTNTGALRNATATQYYVTNGAGQAILGNVGSVTFPVGPSQTVFAPINITNNGTPASFGVRALPSVTQVPGFATGSTSVRQPIVNQQWNVSQITGLLPGVSVSIAPIWLPTQENAGFARTLSVSNVYASTGTVSSAPGVASADPTYPTYFRSSVTLTQTAVNLLNNTPVLVSSQPIPAITSFTPTTQSSGNTITIFGTRFVPGATVSLGGVTVPAANVTVNSDGQITVVVPSNARSGGVVVTQTAGSSTLAGFVFSGMPLLPAVIRDVTPVPVPAGIGDVILTINGAAFGLNNPRVVAVGSGITSSLTPSTNSTTRLVVTVPGQVVRTVGNLVLTVTSLDRLPVSTTVTVATPPALALTSLSPSSTTGNLNPFTILVSGSNFSAQSSFTLGSSTLRVLGVTRNADGSLTASVEAPVGVQSGSLTVTNINSQSASLPFMVNNLPRPVISRVSPGLVPPGSPTTTFTINGRFFVPGAVASFSGIPLTGLQLTGDSLITISVPAALLANPDLAVLTITNPDGQSIGYRLPITVGAPTAVTIAQNGVTPATTSASLQAFTIGISGTGFLGTTRVFLGGQPVTVLSTNADGTALVAVVPGNLNVAGTYQLQVINSYGVAVSVTYVISPSVAVGPAPSITRVNPSFVATPVNSNVTVATNITLTGANFATSGVRVLLGSTALAIISANATSIEATIPAGIPVGSYQLSVVNPDGQSAAQTYLIQLGVSVSAEPLAGIRVYPNPVAESVSVEANLERAAKVVITVTNALGQRVMVVEQNAAAGFYSRSLNINSLPTGAYMVEITDGTRRSVEKIIKN